MEFNYAQGSFPFPDEFAPPKKKAKNEYGLQSAKAMFYSKNRQGFSIFSQEGRDDQALVELAQGRASTDNIRRLFGFYTNQQGQTNQDDDTLAYIDVQVINLATKYINRTVAKLQKYKYKIGLSAVDPISVDEAKEYDSKIKAYYALKQHYETIGVRGQDFFKDINVEVLPEFPEELLFNLTANQKIRKIIDGEKTLALVNNTVNDLSQILRQTDWDYVVRGHGHIHCYHDENGMPRNEWIDPRFWGASYVKNEDFKDAEYQFFIDFITVNQFRKEAENKLSKDEIDSVLRQFAWPNTAINYNVLPDQMVNYDGLRYIPVMRFYFLSNDHKKVVTWKNELGNDMIDERHYQYQPQNTSKTVIPNVYTTVYGGSWVVDSDIVYNYGPKDIPRSNLVNARLPIVSFAPNMKNGRYVSLLSQMVEPLVMLNVAWNKIKDILAKGRLGITTINLSSFENLALGKGGNAWTPREAIEFLFQTNVAVTRDDSDPYRNNNTRKAIEFTATGVTLADYFTTMSTCIRFLDDLGGSTLAETTDLPDRLTSKTMMANVAAGSDAIEYLINAHSQTYFQVSHMNLLLTQASKRNKVAIRGMIPALGKYTTEFFEVPDDLPYCDYGLSMEREATEEEWALFYQELAEMVLAGKLNASDSAFIREIPNMTMARYAMATREQINERKAAQFRAQEQQFQMQSAEQAAAMKLQSEQALEQQKHQNSIELATLQGKIDESLIIRDNELKAEIQGVANMVQERIKKQTGIDSIVKEALRSKSEKYKADAQASSKVATAAFSAQVKREADKKKKPVKAK